MTRHCWFPDNTVLCNFAAVDRLSLLEKVLDGRGRWTQAVAAEAEQPRRYWPKLTQVTTVIIEHRSGFASSVWITDDGEAGHYARRKGICVKNTVDIMREPS